MPDPVTAKYFFDSVVLSNFAAAGQLKLLKNRYAEKLAVTSVVYSELAKGISCGYARLKEVDAFIESGIFRIVDLTFAEHREYTHLLCNLDPGEASTIVCAQSRAGIVITDDRMARNVCSERGVPHSGTIGILKKCCEENLLAMEDADTILQEMIHYGFYSPVNFISAMMK